MVHLVSLESTQEAKVAPGYRLEPLSCLFRAFQTYQVRHNSTEHRAPGYSMNQALNIVDFGL